MKLILLLLIFTITQAVIVRKPENLFSRGPLDYGKVLLDADSASLFVGARGRIFRLWAYNINDTSEKLFSEKPLTISSSEMAECRSSGNSEEDCQTFVRTMFLKDQRENLMICSSAALKPEVRILDASRLEDKEDPQTIIGLCAPDKIMNTTAVLVELGNPRGLPIVYSGIRTGITGENHLIYRPAIVENSREIYPSMRTIYKDDDWLNEPQFVGSFDVGEHVYFFFREIANEASHDEKRIYSRVARICKKDLGGKSQLRQVWTSFVKARLNCSLPGNIPFYFDQIRSVTKSEFEGETLFYTGMSTSDSAYPTSAICVFQLKDINHVFDHGLFTDLVENRRREIGADPNTGHRPGTCVPDSQSLDPDALNFIKSHNLMHSAISSMPPILTQRDAFFHQIHVDIRSEHNVIHAIDKHSSKLWKVSHWRDGSEWKSMILEKETTLDIGGFDEGNRIEDSTLMNAEFLYTTSPLGVHQFPLSSCQQWLACQSCAIDAYCSWNVARGECFPREKIHQQSVGWVTSWPGRGTRECKSVARPVLKKVFPGDSIHFTSQPSTQWFRDGIQLKSDTRTLFTKENGLVLMDLSKNDNGDYEGIVDGKTIVKYRLIVDHEDCAQPKTVSSFKAAQREWCKKMDGYKKNYEKWKIWFENNQQCPVTQNVSAAPNR
ncbi:unnamed protein product, partial [Mesorhabditis belari]|uniref:Sema domain-containing protein n=1 Tax=Mesorhabditis belari TaxID=2138241 RepID=A0AAF3F1W2_9BILA